MGRIKTVAKVLVELYLLLSFLSGLIFMLSVFGSEYGLENVAIGAAFCLPYIAVHIWRGYRQSTPSDSKNEDSTVKVRESGETTLERLSGVWLRRVMAVLFWIGIGVAILMVGIILFADEPGYSAVELLSFPFIITIPYLVIRYRDPRSTTLPLAEYVRGQ